MKSKALQIIAILAAGAIALTVMFFVKAKMEGQTAGESTPTPMPVAEHIQTPEPTDAPSTPIPTRRPATPEPTEIPVKYVDVPDDIRRLVDSLAIPEHSLRGTPASVSANPREGETVLDMNEPGTVSISVRWDENECTDGLVTREEAIAIAKDWLATRHAGVTWEDFTTDEIIVSGIAMAGIDLDGNVENEQETAVSCIVRIEKKVDGIRVFGDQYFCNIDGEGVTYSGLRHRNYEIVDADRGPADREKLCVNIWRRLLEHKAYMENLFKSEYSLDEKIEKYTLEYADNDNDGIFDPVLTIYFTGKCEPVVINCVTGIANIYRYYVPGEPIAQSMRCVDGAMSA